LLRRVQVAVDSIGVLVEELQRRYETVSFLRDRNVAMERQGNKRDTACR